MCGIYGIFNRRETATHALHTIAQRMGAEIGYRGPDSSGIFQHDGLLLGSNRLSIVDVPNGHQPIVYSRSNGRRTVITYNGEVYNYHELRDELRRKDLVPRTNCDTEIVLLAYEAYGEDCVERLQGQFAFAIWDEQKRSLFLARDVAGIKPLFYATVGDAFVFASEPKALLQFDGIQRAPNTDAIAEYFMHGYAFASGYVASSDTYYKQIKTLLPAHSLTVERNVKRPKCYWRAPKVSDTTMSVKKWGQAVRDVMEYRVSDYVAKEVPVGVALSGGIDSSIIAALTVKEMNKQGRKPVFSTIWYEGQKNPDFQHAEELVARFKRLKYEFEFGRAELKVSDYFSELDKMVTHFDEPHWEVKQLAMFRNYGRLKQLGAKVVLTGEGADELFFGYYKKFPGFRNPQLKSAAELKDLWGNRLKLVSSLFSRDFQKHIDHTLHRIMDEAIESYYSGASASADPEKRMQHWYFKTFLPWLLTVNDRCSMAFSLEGRFPFLDNELIRLAFEMPASINARGKAKLVLRDAFQDMLPTSIVEREKAPLPSPTNINFHTAIHDRFAQELEKTRTSKLWDVLSLDNARNLNSHFEDRIDKLGRAKSDQLTSYLFLNRQVRTKTTHVFSMLTLIRWWMINFEPQLR